MNLMTLPRLTIHVKQVCFEVQPVTVLPSQIAQGSYDLPSLKQAGKTIYDINDNAIQAVDTKGNPYPTYQIVPYEGQSVYQLVPTLYAL